MASCTYYNECDPYAAAWLRALMAAGAIPKGEVDERSIVDVRPADLRGFRHAHFFAGIGGWPYALQLAGWPDDDRRVVWTGSCPCQPWSAAGRQAGADDPRDLWPPWFELIRVCGPHVVFGEQTPEALAWFDRVSADLEGAGYAVGACDLPAACVGAPQIRQRLWFVADTDDARRQGAERTRESDPARETRPATCRESLRSDHRSWPPGPREVDRIPVLADGVSGVMGGCKGYGNAIVPQVAAELIAAYLEVAR